VSATYGSLINLVNLFATKASVAANMVSTLQGSQSAAAAGNSTSANNQLNAFFKQVQAQSGKSLTSAQAAVLIKLATAMKA
jgi:hypothetical protein